MKSNFQLKAHIVHLDDHEIFQDGIKIFTNKFFPNLTIDKFYHLNEAIKRIEYCLQNNITIDLIISDISHPGSDGFRFSEIVRQIEIKFNKRIPILILSMHITNLVTEKIQDFLKYNVWDKALPKSISQEELTSVLIDILDKKKQSF